MNLWVIAYRWRLTAALTAMYTGIVNVRLVSTHHLFKLSVLHSTTNIGAALSIGDEHYECAVSVGWAVRCVRVFLLGGMPGVFRDSAKCRRPECLVYSL